MGIPACTGDPAEFDWLGLNIILNVEYGVDMNECRLHPPSPHWCPTLQGARFEDKHPAAVTSLSNDLDELLTCFRYKSPDKRRAVRTTNTTTTPFLLTHNN
jgi:hypothetical protein